MSDYETYKAEVVKVLPNDQYKVQEDEGVEPKLCVAKSHIDQNDINIVIGDIVTVQRIPNSKFHRITYRNT